MKGVTKLSRDPLLKRLRLYPARAALMQFTVMASLS
jgi:hypothetical protein